MKRKSTSCSDRLCGADDCSTCRPGNRYEGERLSTCCGAPSLGEISSDNFGFCSDCKDQAEFEDCDAEEEKEE